MKTGTLRRRLASRFLLVALGPLLALGIVDYVHTSGRLRRQAEVRDELLARSVRAEVERDLQSLASVVAQATRSALALERVDAALVQPFLQQTIAGTADLDALTLLSEEARVLTAAVRMGRRRSAEDLVGLDRSRDPSLRLALAEQTPVWSQPERSAADGSLGLVLSYPVGPRALQATLSLARLETVVARAQADPEAVVAITDSRGRMIFHPDPDRAQVAESLHHLGPLRDPVAGASSHQVFVWGGERFFGGASILPGVGWRVLVARPADLALAELTRVQHLYALAALLVTLLVLFFSLRWTRSLLEPLARLQSATRALAQGDFGATLPRTGARELDDLAEDFRRMARLLGDREAALDAARARYEGLFHALREAVVVHRILPDGRPGEIIEVNARLCEMVGRSREELLGLPILDLFLPESAALAARVHARDVQDPTLPAREFLLHGPGGTVLEVEARGHQLDFGGGPAVFGLLRDRSAERKAARALAESERRFRLLAESTRAVPWEYDLAASRFTYVGPQLETLFGIDPAAWTDLDAWAAHIHPSDRASARNSCDRATSAGDDHELQYRLVGAKGEEHWVHEVVTVHRGPKGPETLRGMLIDVTALKRSEVERAELQEQLRRAQKLEAIGTLAGGIAHDFNNILGAVLGYAELGLAEAPADSELRPYLEEILQAARRARDIVRQILTFSRRSDEQRRPLGLARVVEEALRLLRASIPSSVVIDWAPGERPDWVLADAGQLHQVVVNLVTNAYQALAGRPGRIELELGQRSATEGGEPMVELRVTDDGPGMDEATRARIFDPYFTTKGPGEGSGLGLAVVHGVVAGLGGRIEVESSPGAGATFRVLLPAHRSPPTPEPRSGTLVVRGTQRILLVDDEPALVRVGARVLAALGYQVTGHASSAEALAALRAKPRDWDLLITDLAMPEVDGEALARAARELRRDLPILVCSGYGEDAALSRLSALGRTSFLPKPYDRKSLAVKVARALEQG